MRAVNTKQSFTYWQCMVLKPVSEHCVGIQVYAPQGGCSGAESYRVGHYPSVSDFLWSSSLCAYSLDFLLLPPLLHPLRWQNCGSCHSRWVWRCRWGCSYSWKMVGSQHETGLGARQHAPSAFWAAVCSIPPGSGSLTCCTGGRSLQRAKTHVLNHLLLGHYCPKHSE